MKRRCWPTWQFALPKYHGALALFYNKNIFDRFRLPYPGADWDHDDYLEAMRQIKAAANADGATALWGSMFEVAWERIQVHVNGWDGHFVDPADARRSWMAQLLQPARASLVEDWAGFVRKQYPSQAAGIDLGVFAQGQLEGYSVTAEVFANMSDARRLARPAWEQLYTLGQANVDITRGASSP